MTFTDPATGKSVPLVTTVLGTNDRVTQATGTELRAQVVADIEAARQHLKVKNGITSYLAATAMAARIYFYHGNYALAYERANEVITSGAYTLEPNPADIYSKGNSSSEAIYTIIVNRTENSFGPNSIGNSNFQANKDKGVVSLNPHSEIAVFRNANPSDKRFTDLSRKRWIRIY